MPRHGRARAYPLNFRRKHQRRHQNQDRSGSQTIAKGHSRHGRHTTVLTILTPTYNRAGTLHRVYESLCQQTFKDFEWVVVDDGSTDNTHASVLAWQARAAFPIRYVWQNNQHKKTAFNRGVREARGELIVGLDSDDEMPPDALQIFKSVWDSIPPARRDSYVAVTGLCARPDGSVVGDRYPQDVFDSTAVDVYFRHRIKGEKFGCMRTSVLRKFPFPRTWPVSCRKAWCGGRSRAPAI